MKHRLRSILQPLLICAGLMSLLPACAAKDRQHQMIVSVHDQRMLLLKDGQPQKVYEISTSKFGLSDAFGSYGTPVGKMEIARKIGGRMPPGMVFKDRRPTGEVLPPNAPGRDPIVSRILWLRGTEEATSNAFSRYIYIHGTPEEKRIGKAASYGCIRMRSKDVIELYETVGEGAGVTVVQGSLKPILREAKAAQKEAAAEGEQAAHETPVAPGPVEG